MLAMFKQLSLLHGVGGAVSELDHTDMSSTGGKVKVNMSGPRYGYTCNRHTFHLQYILL